MGRVSEAKPASRLVGFALLTLELTAIRLTVPDGADQTVSLVTLPLSSKTNGPRHEHGRQGCRRRRSRSYYRSHGRWVNRSRYR